MAEIQSLARGLTILNMVANAEAGISITEIARILDIDKSSASRLVQTLLQYEYLYRQEGSRRLQLGKRLHQISWQLLNRNPIRDKAKPYLYRLMQDTGECSHTAIYSEGKALMIDDVEAAASLRVVGGIGRMLFLHCTAVGKGLLAFDGAPFPSALPERTANTMTDPALLRENLELTRLRGYALDDEENELGVRCLAAPIYDYLGNTIAVIGISGPTVRVTYERVPKLARVVMAAAQELSCSLGWVPLRLGQHSELAGSLTHFSDDGITGHHENHEDSSDDENL
ncbi:MAG TPA: IclR family transcriptional regulator [Aggregatilineales bacterium]|nr:IclR family transcriptional regulator [Aggregatilineales bacterium]